MLDFPLLHSIYCDTVLVTVQYRYNVMGHRDTARGERAGGIESNASGHRFHELPSFDKSMSVREGIPSQVEGNG